MPLVAEAPKLLLAKRYQGGINISDYLISEKLDGVRAYWDGQQLHFRSGKTIHAPDWFVQALPQQRPLDGELWLGRERFAELSGIVRSKSPDDHDWRQVHYRLFELPEAPGTFSERVRQLHILTKGRAPWLHPVKQFRLEDEQALQARLKKVVAEGGEGLMLHRADAHYTTGRSSVLLKVTPWFDAEARVIDHLPGKGKYQGMVGALRVEMPNGLRFSLGSGLTDAQRRNPPAIGSQVTYRYRSLTRKGIPRFARFLRIRENSD